MNFSDYMDYFKDLEPSDIVNLPQVFRNGATTADPEDIFTIDSLSGLTGTDFTTGNPSFSHKNIPGTLFKLRLDFAGNTTIYALQVAMQSDRDWPATRT